MKKKLALLGVTAFLMTALQGCLLPCQICLACAGAGSSNVSEQSIDESLPIDEIAPNLQTRAMTRAVEH